MSPAETAQKQSVIESFKEKIAGKGHNNPPEPTLDELKAMSAKDFFENYSLDMVVTLAQSEFKSEETDVSTQAARDRIISAAFKFSTLKSLFVGKANEQTEEWKRRTKEVNAKRDAFIVSMDRMRDYTRQPVTEWEAKDKNRQDAHKAAFSELSELSIVNPQITSGELRERLEKFQTYKTRDWEEYAKDATPKIEQTEEFLQSTLEITIKAEQDREELRKFREAEEQRLAEQKRIDDARAEEDRKREEERRQKERDDAIALKAAQDAEAAKQKEIDDARIAKEQAEAEAERLRQKAIADAKQKELDDAEAERKRLADIEKAKEDERKRLEAEQAAKQAEIEKRESDKRHVNKINTAAARSIFDIIENIEIDVCIRIVDAIAQGKIPNVEVKY